MLNPMALGCLQNIALLLQSNNLLMNPRDCVAIGPILLQCTIYCELAREAANFVKMP